jgi:hypothetical protein
VKKAIELLYEAKKYIGKSFYASSPYQNIAKYETFYNTKEAEKLVSEAIVELTTPRWETPEQREKRTGEKWPDDAAVYALVELLHGELLWEIMSYKTAIISANYIICATEAGPPPDGWKPEEKS